MWRHHRKALWRHGGGAWHNGLFLTTAISVTVGADIANQMTSLWQTSDTENLEWRVAGFLWAVSRSSRQRHAQQYYAAVYSVDGTIKTDMSYAIIQTHITNLISVRYSTTLLEAYFRYVTNWDHIIAEHQVCDIYRRALNICTGLVFRDCTVSVYLGSLSLLPIYQSALVGWKKGPPAICWNDLLIERRYNNYNFGVSLHKMPTSHFDQPTYHHLYLWYKKSDMSSKFIWKMYTMAQNVFLVMLLF